MFQPLPYIETKFVKNVQLEDIVKTNDDSVIGYFVEVDLPYSYNIEKKIKIFPFAPEIKKSNPDGFSEYMKTIKPDSYTRTEKLICDWFDKRNYLIP